MKIKLVSTLALGTGVAILLLLLIAQTGPVQAAGYTVCPAGPPTCDYATIQEAVDAAGDGDVIQIATGLYTGVNTYGGLSQIVYISKSVTLQGGYTPNNWDTPDPIANPTTLDAQGQGRGLYITGDVTPTLAGLRITGGDAADLGGGLSGKDAGGGLYIIDAQPVISQNWIFSNTAESGGGLFLWYSRATLNHNEVTSNTSGYYGGGLTLRESDAALNGTVIDGNKSSSGGGLFLYQSDAGLNDNQIAANVAQAYGGGLYLGFSDAALVGNRIADNEADYSGGIYLYTSDARLEDNVISANSAAHDGGGLYLYTSNARLDGNVVAANAAGANGGGFYLYNESDATITNTLVVDNQGSGLDIRASSPRLLHLTVARNTGTDTHGIYISNVGVKDSFVIMTNTILVGQETGIEVVDGNKAQLEATLWGDGDWSNGTDWTGDGQIFTGTINLWDDPAFVDPDVGDYHVAAESAARDTGIDAGVTTDMDDQARPSGDGYDVGADEFFIPPTHPALALAQQAGPDPVQAGSSLTYTLRVTNTGDVDLHATITDLLPAHGTPTGTLTWSPAVLLPGGTWTAQVVITAAPAYAGPLVNKIQVVTQEGVTDTDTLTTLATPPPNNPTPAHGTDEVSLTPALGWHSDDPDEDAVSYAVALGTTNPPPLAATGLTTTHYAPGQLDPGTTYYWIVTATDGISVSVGPIWRFTTLVPPHPAIQVGQQAGPDPVQAGSSLTYTLRVTNSGNVDLRATITDLLPAHGTPTGTLTWSPEALPPGGTWTAQVVITTTLEYAGPLVNRVQVVTQEGVTDTDTLTTLATLPPNHAPDVPDQPIPGDGAHDVPIDQVLGWQSGDPDSDPTRYTVALGTTNPPPIVATDLITTSYAPASLAYGTTYYWAVTATDGTDVSQGPVWHFVTAAPPKLQLEAGQQIDNPVLMGTQLLYTLRVTNTGEARLHATITDTLPEQVTQGGTRVWRAVTIPPGEVWVGQVVANAAPGYVGPLVNRVQVTTQEGVGDEHVLTATVVEKLLTIGPSQGGTLVATHPDGVTITIQALPGAVPTLTQLGYTSRTTLGKSYSDFFAGGAFELDPFRGGALLPGLTFEKPLTVTIDLPGPVAAGLDRSTLALRYWDGQAWSSEGITITETTGQSIDNRLVARVAHLSQFAVFAQAQPAEPHIYLPLVIR